MYRLDEIVTGKHDKSKERFACLETVLTEANEKAEQEIDEIELCYENQFEGSWF